MNCLQSRLATGAYTTGEKYDVSEIVNLFQLAVMKIVGTGALRVQRNTVLFRTARYAAR